MTVNRRETRKRRKLHIRKKIGVGTAEIPRVTVFRSNRYMYVQAVDDEKGVTLVGLSDSAIGSKKDEKPVDRAARLGEEFGKLMKKAKLEKVIFDRSGYKYHGRVKSFADSLRKSGIKF